MLEPEQLMSTVIEVTRSLGVRAIVNMPGSKAEWPAGELPDHLRSVGAVDHDLLFPRCAAAIHHGGAGTLAGGIGKSSLLTEARRIGTARGFPNPRFPLTAGRLRS